ncbi:hypothetical protein L3Q82_006004 [Scortum barcoo]|uniref:Uncharacterized protein n=1 Tax=Scortum barcoo TaxID=214431 RepID=A0ACB8X248_9TELE|nr:hypothetical protein L3Q82_006004 [Scortum barcoo]
MEDHLQQNNARECSSPPPPPSPNLLTPTVDQVRTQLKKIKARKATGPDGISSRLLQDCADQLCQVVCYIFNLSLSLERVPVLWKTSCVVPVPKTSHPKEPNHFRPVALTSHLMKALERIVLRHLRPLCFQHDPPLTAQGEAGESGASDQLAAWVTNYLTDRPQFVRLQDCVSDVVVCSTGAPQGTVLSPFLFTLYTSDFTYSTDSCHLQKFSDDTAIVGCVSEGNDLVCWGGGCSERDKKRLNRLIKRASSVCGCPLDSIEVMGERRALAKLSTIMDNTSHPSASDCGGLKQLLHGRYRECSLLLFTETWLTALLTPDTAAELDGFTLLRADRSKESGKRKGGGLAVFVNDRWCNPGHITVKEQHCCKDIELLAVSMRPYYLPREFTHALTVVVYIPPSANADAACDVLLSAVSRLQTQHPDALLLISGDFNHASPSSSLPKFTQYVTCHTRDNKTLDLFYANTKEAYHSLPLPPLGRADHNLVHLLPVYKTLVHRQPAVTSTVKKWSEEAEEALKDCFNTTLWDVFSDAHGEDIDSLTHCLDGLH